MANELPLFYLNYGLQGCMGHQPLETGSDMRIHPARFQRSQPNVTGPNPVLSLFQGEGVSHQQPTGGSDGGDPGKSGGWP